MTVRGEGEGDESRRPLINPGKHEKRKEKDKK